MGVRLLPQRGKPEIVVSLSIALVLSLRAESTCAQEPLKHEKLFSSLGILGLVAESWAVFRPSDRPRGSLNGATLIRRLGPDLSTLFWGKLPLAQPRNFRFSNVSHVRTLGRNPTVYGTCSGV